jgi:hypothetical protein
MGALNSHVKLQILDEISRSKWGVISVYSMVLRMKLRQVRISCSCSKQLFHLIESISIFFRKQYLRTYVHRRKGNCLAMLGFSEAI